MVIYYYKKILKGEFMKSNYDEIRQILNETGIDTKKNTNYDNLEIDSITIIELILRIEKFYGITILQNDIKIENFSNVNAINNLLLKYLKKETDESIEANEELNFYI
ncbi:acyl carrier protein [Clostridium perfringens]|jgi:acyl carrier protein|nr:acyl carrier protein [Clostridium perfringens]EGT0688127.1 acyl carrier protein [Clostridium perfringens]